MNYLSWQAALVPVLHPRSVIGKFFPSVARKLTARGASVIACFNSYADITVPYYPHPSYTTGHPDQNDFERAGKFGRDLGRGGPEKGA